RPGMGGWPDINCRHHLPVWTRRVVVPRHVAVGSVVSQRLLPPAPTRETLEEPSSLGQQLSPGSRGFERRPARPIVWSELVNDLPRRKGGAPYGRRWESDTPASVRSHI